MTRLKQRTNRKNRLFKNITTIDHSLRYSIEFKIDRFWRGRWLRSQKIGVVICTSREGLTGGEMKRGEWVARWYCWLWSERVIVRVRIRVCEETRESRERTRTTEGREHKIGSCHYFRPNMRAERLEGPLLFNLKWKMRKWELFRGSLHTIPLLDVFWLIDSLYFKIN
jgi:hypothetical protein